MPLVGIAYNGEAIPWDRVPPSVLQPEIVKAMWGGDRGGLHLSDLIGCPHHCVRQRRYDYYLPVHNVYWMARGKAWDALVEKYGVEGRETQRVVKRKLDGVWVYGTPDIIDHANKRVEDNKAPVKLKGYQEIPLTYALQVNGYRWLLQDEVEINTLALDACAHFGWEQIAVPVFPLDEVEEELSMRLHMLQEVADLPDIVPQCGNPKCYCYSDGMIDTNNPHRWGIGEIYGDTKAGA